MENLKSYLDGELDLAQQTEVETHLRNDAQLQQMVEEFRTISTTLKTVDTGEPYGLDKLEERLAEKGKLTLIERKKMWRQAVSWSASGGLVLLIAAVLFPVFAQSKVTAKRSQLESQAKFQDASKADQERSASSSAAPQKQETLDGLKQPVAPGDTRGRIESSFKSQELPQESRDQDLSVTDQPVAPQDTTTQWYEGAESKKDASASAGNQINGSSADMARKRKAVDDSFVAGKTEPESDFKAQMRFETNKSAQSVKGPRDTPQGIYLERAGETQVKVEDVGRAVNEATGMVQGLDGFVVSSNVQNRTEGGMATMTLRVPTKNFQTALERLEKMGERLSSNSSSQDITTEMVDNGTRMVSWADEEKRVMDALAKTKDENRKYYLRQELSQIRVNLEAYRAQVKSLKQRAEFSTINATFLSGDQADKPGVPSSNWSGSAYKGAKDSLSSVGQLFGVVGIYFLVFSPIWLPFLVVAFMIRKKNQS